jgi:phospholipase C
MKRLKRKKWPALIGLGAMLTSQAAAPLAFGRAGTPVTPITHVIVLIGENHTFDNIYATYNGPQRVFNLLSRGIVNADGSSGPSASLAAQYQVNTPLPPTYFINVPANKKTAYSPLPSPGTSYAPTALTSLANIDANPTGVAAPFDDTVTFQDLQAIEPNIPTSRLSLFRTGNTGIANFSTDTRVTNATDLPNTVFQWTGANLPYDAYIGDQVHRLFHMWQQSDCNVAKATRGNPSGCTNDLYPYVGIARNDGSGSNSMGFLNMQNGDAPYLRQLSQLYTISDNYHQAGMGGTAINHQYIGTADDVYWTTFDGLTVPPANIANPNPSSSTSDKYVDDGAWTNCSDTTQPGIAPIVNYLGTLP